MQCSACDNGRVIFILSCINKFIELNDGYYMKCFVDWLHICTYKFSGSIGGRETYIFIQVTYKDYLERVLINNPFCDALTMCDALSNCSYSKRLIFTANLNIQKSEKEYRSEVSFCRHIGDIITCTV